MSDQDNNYFGLASGIAKLVAIAKKHDPDGLAKASNAVDMSPSLLLRGMAFLGEAIESYDDPNPMQAGIARSVINEIMALCAVLIDMDVEATFIKTVKDNQPKAKAEVA